MIITLILSLLPTLSADYPDDAPSPTPTPDAVIWFVSEMHSGAPEDSGQWNISVWDFNNITQEISSDYYAFAIGDLTSSGTAGQYTSFHTEFDKIDPYVIFKNYTYGNHDQTWANDGGPLIGATTWGNYTKTIGNIMVIALSTERNWTASTQAIYSHQTDWYNTTVQANQDKILITIAHHGVYNTTPATNMTNVAEGGDYCIHINQTVDMPIIEYVLDNYRMNLFVHGHNHIALNQTWHGMKYLNTSYNDTYEHYFANDGGVMDYASLVSKYPHDSESIFLFLYDNNNSAIMCRRNHTQECWYDTNQTLTLDYVFREDGVNSAPVISAPSPSNNTDNMNLTLSNLSFTINDGDGDIMSYTIEYNNLSNTFDAQTNGTKTPIINYGAVNPLTLNTTYTWWVNVTDGEVWTNESFNFTTLQFQSGSIRITGRVDMFDATDTATSVVYIASIFAIISTLMGFVAVMYYIKWR